MYNSEIEKGPFDQLDIVSPQCIWRCLWDN